MEYLQKNFSPCAWCEKYGLERMVHNKKEGHWFDDATLFRQLNSMPVSHSICPQCNEKTLAEIDLVLGEKK
jgi:hypothetical protein